MSKFILFFSSILPLLTSCASIGPHYIQADRGNYNNVIQNTENEQILRNIVHLRYTEPTTYLKISNITSSYSFGASLSGNIHLGQQLGTSQGVDSSSITNDGALSPSVSYSDSPTISYVPIDDAAFVSTMEQPVSFNHVALLYGSEPDYFELLTELVVSRIGHINNGFNPNTPFVTDQSEYYEYKKLISLINEMFNNRTARINLVKYHEEYGFMLHFTEEGNKLPNAALIKKMLDVPQKYRDIFLINNISMTVTQAADGAFHADDSLKTNQDNLVFIKMRSVSGILSYLSDAVQVPQSDLDSGVAMNYHVESNNNFAIDNILDGVMKILSSDVEPRDAFVKAYVHNHWFYIKNSDIESKYSFSMLIKLMTLSSGYGQPLGSQSAPIITVPVGGNVK
jgi:hypothetical protein